ncbi:MAG: lipid IV(A) 3-deoxy-D-manno-octulosonic acid transferase [Pseudomonadota bacterium]
MRLLYNLLVLVGLPFVVLYWLWRALADAAYRPQWSQRFGLHYPSISYDRPRVWLHAVSVGEVQAAAPLVRALRSRLPDAQVLITTVTPTGRDRVRLLFGDSVETAYVPYDLLGSVSRFYNHVRPNLAIIIETELWPNLFHVAGQKRIPLILASARISPRSMPRYKTLVSLFRDALSNGIIIAAQSEADRRRFVELGAPESRTFVSGNIKFDVEYDPGHAIAGHQFRSDMQLLDRPVWVAASTHQGEEEVVLDAHRRILNDFPDALLILVPRHPGRFDEAAQLLERSGLEFQRRTQAQALAAKIKVLLGDTMGEVPMFYGASDVAFVGGSIVKVGGHNLLEPAALSLPIVTGPHLFNAQDIATMFIDSGAAIIADDANAVSAAVRSLLNDAALRDNMG